MSATTAIHPNWLDPLFWIYVAELQAQLDRRDAARTAKRKAGKNGKR